MIILNKEFNIEKSRDELFVKNIDCGLNIYHFCKYDNLITSEFMYKIKEIINKYFKDDIDSYSLNELNHNIKILCKEYNVISLKIERG